MVSIFKSICRMCHGGCGVVITLKNGRVQSIIGDKDNPNSKGFICLKGKASIELLYHPDRLKYPMKRVGKRGGGQFKTIDWDEAICIVAENCISYRGEYGAESMVMCQGTDRNYQEWIFRFANTFGTPNVLGPAHICFYPRLMASIFTFGEFTFPDFESVPECIVAWGSNKMNGSSDGVVGIRLLEAVENGSQLVVIDPKRTRLAEKAKYWLQIKPGTDVVLALGMINMIIQNEWFDKDFVNDYTVGFDELREYASEYSLEKVSNITWVPPDLIEKVTHMYARANSAAFDLGTGVTQNKNSFDTIRSVYIISGICGNIDEPGGDIIWQPSNIIGRRKFPLTEHLSEKQASKRLGSDKYKILAMTGWVPPEAVWDAILTKKPYPVKGILIFGSNLLTNYANSKIIYKALQQVDFSLVTDLFLTPTAQMADIVLPASSWLERDQIVEFNSFIAARRKIAQVDDCKSDEEIINLLAAKMGLGEYFWNSVEDALDFKLKPIGYNWKQFVEKSYIANDLEYSKYRTKGFKTKNNKFNIYNEGLKRMGYPPLPQYIPINEVYSSGYILSSGHLPFSFNSEFRNVDSLRNKEPFPYIYIHPLSAEKEGIRDGEWVIVYTDQNYDGVRLLVKISDNIDPRVIYITAAWWYPELEFSEAWTKSNINMITTDECADLQMGASNLRGIICKIRKEKCQV